MRDKMGLVAQVVRALAGDALIFFEGDLSRSRLRELPGASDVETPILRRNTISPPQDFVVLPLEPDTASAILDAVVPQGGIVHRIVHIQIAKSGRLVFAAYDNFHPECTIAFQDVPVELLENLRRTGVLRSFTPSPS